MSMSTAAVYEFTVRGVQDGQDVLNVLHYQYETGAGEAAVYDIGVAITALVTVWQEQALPIMSDQYRVQEYHLAEIGATIGGDLADRPHAVNVTAGALILGTEVGDSGGLAGEACPTYVARTGRKITTLPSRNYKGSFRLGAVVEDDTDENLLGNAPFAAFQGLLDQLFDLVPIGVTAGTGLRLGVFSQTLYRQQDLPLQAAARYFHRLQYFVAHQVLGSQLSRKRRFYGS